MLRETLTAQRRVLVAEHLATHATAKKLAYALVDQDAQGGHTEALELLQACLGAARAAGEDSLEAKATTAA